MKMTKLLTGVAAAAILAGAAHAQVELQQGDMTAVSNTSGTPTAGDNWFASELSGGITNITVPLEFSIAPSTASAWPTAPNVEVLLQVDISNAVLDRSLVDGDIVASSASAGPTASSTCTSSDMTVDANGAAGDSTVTFRIADIAECSARDSDATLNDTLEMINFALPLILSGGDVDVTVTMTRASNGAAIASGSWSQDGLNRSTFGATTATTGDPLITQISAIDYGSTSAGIVVDSASTYTAFQTGPATTAATVAGGTFNFAPSGAFLADGSAVGAGDITDADLFCTFDDVTGLDGSAHTFSAGFTNTAANTTASNPVAFNSTATGTATITLAALGTAPIQPGYVNCTGSVNFATAAGLDDLAIPSFEIAAMRREGPTTDIFEWVGDSSLSTSNVFRITGLGATAPGATVIVSDSSTGLDGEYPISLPTPSNGEVILNENHLTNAIGSFGRANIQFSFQDATLDNSGQAGVLVRRFLVGNNGTLTDFGNENDDDTSRRDSTVAGTGNEGGGDE